MLLNCYGAKLKRNPTPLVKDFAWFLENRGATDRLEPARDCGSDLSRMETRNDLLDRDCTSLRALAVATEDGPTPRRNRYDIFSRLLSCKGSVRLESETLRLSAISPFFLTLFPGAHLRSSRGLSCFSIDSLCRADGRRLKTPLCLWCRASSCRA